MKGLLQIHWFSIFNSFMMVIFLVGLVFMILMRTLRKDYARYSKDEEMDDMVSAALNRTFISNFFILTNLVTVEPTILSELVQFLLFIFGTSRYLNHECKLNLSIWHESWKV